MRVKSLELLDPENAAGRLLYGTEAPDLLVQNVLHTTDLLRALD